MGDSAFFEFLTELIRNAYNTRDASHMALGKDYAYWTSRPVANTCNLTVNQLVEMFNFLIDNIICSAQSENLRNLVIALRILRIPRLRSTCAQSGECVNHVCVISRSHVPVRLTS